jgi:acylphosphatase
MNAEPVRVRVVVRGRVQGVFFRDSVRRLALERRVAGWVRNRPDGTVEGVFEGEPGSVAELVEFCRVGPGAARVKEAATFVEEPEGLREFSVR